MSTKSSKSKIPENQINYIIEKKNHDLQILISLDKQTPSDDDTSWKVGYFS